MNGIKIFKTATNKIQTTENTKLSMRHDDYVLSNEYLLSGTQRTGEITISKSQIVYIENVGSADIEKTDK